MTAVRRFWILDFGFWISSIIDCKNYFSDTFIFIKDVRDYKKRRPKAKNQIYLVSIFADYRRRLSDGLDDSAPRTGRTALLRGRTRNVRARRLGDADPRRLRMVRKTRFALLAANRILQNLRRLGIRRPFRLCAVRARNGFEFVDFRKKFSHTGHRETRST